MATVHNNSNVIHFMTKERKEANLSGDERLDEHIKEDERTTEDDLLCSGEDIEKEVTTAGEFGGSGEGKGGKLEWMEKAEKIRKLWMKRKKRVVT